MMLASRLAMLCGGKTKDPQGTVSAISPAIGEVAGGVAVTITGTNFKHVLGVTIGGVACTSVVRVSDTSITAVTPAKTLGTYDVVVTTKGRTQTLAGGYNSWDPTAAGAGQHLWKNFVQSGGLVSQWTDRTANAHHATQSTAGNKPSYQTSPQEELSIAAGQMLSNSYLAGSGALTVGVRWRLTSTPGSGTFYSLVVLEQSATKTFFEILLSNIGGAYLPYTIGGKLGSATVPGANVALDTNAHRGIWTYTGGTNTDVNQYTMLLDGAAKTIAVSSLNVKTATSIGSVGGRWDTAGPTLTAAPIGAYAELVVFASVLSAGDKTLLDRYLASHGAA